MLERYYSYKCIMHYKPGCNTITVLRSRLAATLHAAKLPLQLQHHVDPNLQVGHQREAQGHPGGGSGRRGGRTTDPGEATHTRRLREGGGQRQGGGRGPGQQTLGRPHAHAD